jgi:hypothetical protein
MDSKQTISEKESDSSLKKPPETTLKSSAEAPWSFTGHDPIKPEASYIIPSEILRALIDQGPRPSRFHAVSNNPLIVGIIGILIGGGVTSYFTYRLKVLEFNLGARQQELVHGLSFSDEVDKLRIQRLGEVWERLDQDEFAIDQLLADSRAQRSSSKAFNSRNTKRAVQITKLIQNDQAIVSKYRFWLGEELFQKAGNYLDINVKYSLNELGATSESDSSELSNARKRAKQDILQVRNLFLEGQPPGQIKTQSSP